MTDLDRLIMKNTNDDWSPNFDGDQVKLRLHNITNSPYGRPWRVATWRVAVWGNDDIGMIKDFGEDFDAAAELFDTLAALAFVDFDDCRALGMENF